ncbi:amino acid ABC transporter permease [Pararhizobium sp. YC-54]|uniref:amino acid ABC transporter permease n=1 Tax=Pararhizobium sp. YC-54 TaxID=2986920 RepID=UPI0021F6B4C0|nr:amino acid ABC transporter permease [Pararhizobium sp. YC-54]MCW0002138.1 amino acid ABC transporter permease [Pararhizobium sp. YC-54]
MYELIATDVPKFFPFLLKGALVTLQLSIVSMACALVIGLGVALARLSGIRILDWVFGLYVEIWRDVPLIVQLMVIYFTLPEVGISLPGFWAGVLGLSLNLGAYLSEVFRSAISSVDPGQKEAARSIGMSHIMTYRRVVLPQALRVAIPTVGGYFISLLKDSSLVSFIAVNELMRNGTILISNTFRSMEIYMMVAFIYFILSFVASRVVREIEQRLTPKHLRTRGGLGRAQLPELVIQ